MLLLPIATAVVSQLRAPRYTASSEVLVHREQLATSLTGLQVPFTDAATAERVIETQVQLARLPELAALVIDAAGARDLTPSDLLQSSEATARAKADIIELSVTDSSATSAERLATAYAEEFVGYRLRLDAKELDQAARGVENEMRDLPQTSTPSPLASDLQDRLQQIRTLQALQTPSAIVVRRAEKAESVQSSFLIQTVGAALVGALLGVSIAFLIETVDTRARSSREIADRLGMPLLARVVAPSARLQKQRKLVLLEDPDAEGAESFAFLRTGLQFANESVSARTIMVTSAVEGEGKSTVLANLAIACARAGTRVLFVDVDLWRPMAHNFFGLESAPGLSDVLRRQCTLDQAVRRVDVTLEGSGSTASIQVLPSGSHTKQAHLTELPGVFRRLAARAELVLVDGPPLLRIGDALSITKGVDALLLVARLNVVRNSMLDELGRLLAETPTAKLGFVVTNAEQDAGYRSHRYGYGDQQSAGLRGRARLLRKALARRLGRQAPPGRSSARTAPVAVPGPLDLVIPAEGRPRGSDRRAAPGTGASAPGAGSSDHWKSTAIERRLEEIEARIRSTRAGAEASLRTASGRVTDTEGPVPDADAGKGGLWDPDFPASSPNGPAG